MGYIRLMDASACREEHACRFCHQRLPDWQTILTPQEDHLPPQCLPTMSVTFNDEVNIYKAAAHLLIKFSQR